MLGAEGSMALSPLNLHSPTYPPSSHSDQHQSVAVLATVYGELRNLTLIIEQELQSEKQDTSYFLHREQMASDMANLDRGLQNDLPLAPRKEVATELKWGPSAVSPSIPVRSRGDSSVGARVAGFGPSAAPPVPPSFGDRPAECTGGGVRFNMATSDPRGSPMSPQKPSAPNGRGEWEVDDEPYQQDKNGFPEVAADLEETRLGMQPIRGFGSRKFSGLSSQLTRSYSMTLTTGQTNQFQKLFNSLTHDHHAFLTVDESLDILKWAAPERSFERRTVEKALAKLDMLAKSMGRGSSSTLGEVTCDFRAFCYLMGQFDPKSFNDPQDINGEIKDHLLHLRRAFKGKSKHTIFLQDEERFRRMSSAKEQKGPFSGKIGLAFDTIPAFVILGNAIVIGVSADLDSGSVVWEVFELFFLFFFTAEFGLKARLVGFRSILFGPDKWWNYFDLFCIITAAIDQFFVYLEKFTAGGGLSIKDIIPISLLKMLKLVRLARLVRLLRFKIFHELKMMVQGVVSGVKVLFWAIVLLFFVVFILGIVMRKIVGDEQIEFSTVFAAMFTLFRCFTDDCSAYDGTPLSERLRTNLGPTGFGLIWMIAYILVMLFVTIGIFNLIMAIFIDNVVNAQMQRKQQQLGETAEAMEVRIHEVIGARFHVNGFGSTDEPESQQTEKERKPWWKVFTERFSNIADPNQYTEDGKREQMSQRRTVAILHDVDDEEKVVTREIFSEWLTEQEILDFLEEVDVETSTRWELFDALDVDGGGELTVDELVSGLMRLRGPISKNDIVATRLKLTYVTELVEDICRKLDIKLTCDKETTSLREVAW